ncbi:MAG: biotin--[acetyl-CoA-carboxylase] ligase [Nocardioides sp.]
MTRPAVQRPPLDASQLAGVASYDVRISAQDPSTNATAAELARSGEPAGVVVVTEHQTAGRGRLDRVWETPARSALTFSVILRPDLPPASWPWLPLLSGVAVVSALREFGVRASLKWPNDVLLGDRKVAGLLAERVETDTGPAAVLGIGINVSTAAEELPVETATSLALAGHDLDRTTLLIRILTAIAHEAVRLHEGPEALARDYRELCHTLGRQVRVEQAAGPLVGEAIGIDDDGGLIVAGPDGPVTVHAGDVVHVRAQSHTQ